MDFRIDPRVEARLDPLDAAEYETLKAKIAREGCRPGSLTVGRIGPERVLADGHNTVRICQELGIEPCAPVELTFETFQDLLEWVDENQLARRNAAESWKEAKIEERRQRVKEAHDAGESTRQIAAKEGVSQATVMSDLHREVSKNAGEQGGCSKNTPQVENSPADRKIYCESCTTRLRKGQALPGKCRDCKDVRAAARADKQGGNLDADTPEPAPKAAPMDDLGNELPKSLRDTFAGNRETLTDLRKLISECRRVLKGLGGWNPYLREHATDEMLKTVSDDLKNALPYCICPQCDNKGCDTCKQHGWLPKWKYAELELKSAS